MWGFFIPLLQDFISLLYLYFTTSVSHLSLLPINTPVHTGNKEEIKSPGRLHCFLHKYCHFNWNNERTQLEEYPCHLKPCFDPKIHRHSPHPAPAKQCSTTKINTVAQACAGSEAATDSGSKSRDSWQPRHKAILQDSKEWKTETFHVGTPMYRELRISIWGLF